MGDLTDMIAVVEADIGQTVSSNTVPTQDQVVAWANSGTLLLAGLLCSSGRFDLLMKLIESEEKTDGANGKVSLPDTNDVIIGWLSIEIGTASAVYVANVKDLREVLKSQADTIAGADAANPVCAFGDGKLYYAPKTGPDRAVYTFVEKPTTMVKTSAEDFPYSEVGIPVVTEYMLYKTYSQREKNLEKANIHLQAFINFTTRITGLPGEVITNAVP